MNVSWVHTAGRPLRIGLCLAVAGCGVMLPSAALAELSNDTLLGAGLRYRPAYDGARAQSIELVPVIRYLGEPFFARSTQGVLEAGVRTALAPGLHAGAQLAYEGGRRAADSDFLRSHRVADIQRGASVGLQLEWDHSLGPMPLSLLARLRKHTDTAQGTEAELRLSAGVFQSGPFSAGIFTQAGWADKKSARSVYGIDAQQAATTGLPAFQAGSGWLHASAGVLWSYEINRQWIVVGSVEGRRLFGDTARSPLAQRAWNSYISTGLAYRY